MYVLQDGGWGKTNGFDPIVLASASNKKGLGYSPTNQEYQSRHIILPQQFCWWIGAYGCHRLALQGGVQSAWLGIQYQIIFVLMKLKSMIYLLMEKALSPCTDKIVCISKAEKASAEREHIAKDDKLALIPNGIDVSAVRNAVAKSRKELGIAEDAFVVGMIGRLSPQKAPDVFIRAAKLIHDEIPNSAFIIVGSGEEEDEVKSFAKENGLELVISGWTDEPYSYLWI